MSLDNGAEFEAPGYCKMCLDLSLINDESK